MIMSTSLFIGYYKVQQMFAKFDRLTLINNTLAFFSSTFTEVFFVSILLH